MSHLLKHTIVLASVIAVLGSENEPCANRNGSGPPIERTWTSSAWSSTSTSAAIVASLR